MPEFEKVTSDEVMSDEGKIIAAVSVLLVTYHSSLATSKQ
jgi:hypothetical protein